jgi:hypothetical protein
MKRTMKIATAFIVSMLSCASAFGLHGANTATSMKRVGSLISTKPMVQAMDIHGNRLGSVSDECHCLLIGEGVYWIDWQMLA